MKRSHSKQKQRLVKTRAHTAFPHKLAKTFKEHKANLDLLFALQRLAFPELSKGIRMDRKAVRLIRPKN